MRHKMTINELIKLIEQWAIDRGLDENGTVEGQLIKTAEEVAELIIGISKDDIDVIKDSVGDVFVTLVVGNMLNKKYDINICIDKAKESRMWPKRKVDLIHFIIQQIKSLLVYERYMDFEISSIIECLMDICDWYELDFTDCVESAYKEIAGRKGKVINGTFWKSE